LMRTKISAPSSSVTLPSAERAVLRMSTRILQERGAFGGFVVAASEPVASLLACSMCREPAEGGFASGEGCPKNKSPSSITLCRYARNFGRRPLGSLRGVACGDPSGSRRSFFANAAVAPTATLPRLASAFEYLEDRDQPPGCGCVPRVVERTIKHKSSATVRISPLFSIDPAQDSSCISPVAGGW
jgi:hypothetical protein